MNNSRKVTNIEKYMEYEYGVLIVDTVLTEYSCHIETLTRDIVSVYFDTFDLEDICESLYVELEKLDSHPLKQSI